MRLNKYLSGAAILSLISSCTYYIPLDNVNEPSKLVLYCYPGNGENTVVRLSRSLPVGSKIFRNSQQKELKYISF